MRLSLYHDELWAVRNFYRFDNPGKAQVRVTNDDRFVVNLTSKNEELLFRPLFRYTLSIQRPMIADKKIKRTSKLRLDRYLFERGLAQSREQGQALILAGQVLVNGQKKDKAGTLVAGDADIRILGEQMPYVSRGGLKLEKALHEFKVDVKEATALDVGASTGGFTDCLLQHGARKVYAVDVGYGQMAWKIRQEPRVVVIERVNIREMAPTLVPETVDLAVIDVSFISLEKVLPSVMPFLKAGGRIIALIKPQFEVGKGQVGKGGIVRDEVARNTAVEKVKTAFQSAGLDVQGIIPSPITGQDGNVEYLIHAKSLRVHVSPIHRST
jgi:23S rRNA (cytidine1920-2'-O)/16S rRNA (cytidine1409-2'-O)-methyltransferase